MGTKWYHWVLLALVILATGSGVVLLGNMLFPPLVADELETPQLLLGSPMESASFATLVAGDECAQKPEMVDRRSPDDPSLGILSRLSEGDFDVARQWAGFQVVDSYGCRKAQPGQLYLDLKRIELKCGPAVLQPTVLGGDGAPQPGVLLFLSWPGAEQFPSPVDPPLHPNGIGAFTNGDGNVGWGFGPGSQLTPGSGGPFDVWGSAGVGPLGQIFASDAFTHDGWFDNHCIFNPIFQLTVKSGEVPPPVAGTYNLVNLDEDGIPVGYIPFVEEAPQGTASLGLMRDGDIVGYVEWGNLP